jgi:hypothetical protein
MVISRLLLSGADADFACSGERQISGMIHGRSAETALNSRTKKRTSGLTGFADTAPKSLAEPELTTEARLAALEKQVVDLWEVVNRLDGAGLDHFYAQAMETEEKKPGPGKSISDAELFRYRDGLAGYIEEVWPQMVQPLLGAANPRKLAAVLKKFARPEQLQPIWQSRFLEHPIPLFDFLHSERFRKKPPRKTVIAALNLPANDERRKRAANRLPTRQIANAMAGVPELSWRTSLDRCSKNPSAFPVGANTEQHYRAIFDIPVRDRPDTWKSLT